MMTYQKKTGLGRGLSALLDDTEVVENRNQQNRNQQVTSENSLLGTISHVKISQVEVNPFQPRSEFE
jgi:ParB family chromosome partitioning protein